MTAQRNIAILLLLFAGVFSLPVVAYFFDDPGTENWIIPIQLVVMAGLGGLVGRLLPGLVGANQSANRPIMIGAVIGVVMAVVGIIIFFFLLNGFSGA